MKNRLLISADGRITVDYRTQPLDVLIATSLGDITRRHLVCRNKPNFFNSPCYQFRKAMKLPTADRFDTTSYPIDSTTRLPVICLRCSAITDEVKKQLPSLYQIGQTI